VLLLLADLPLTDGVVLRCQRRGPLLLVQAHAGSPCATGRRGRMP
jgi:hypothetical protein